MAANLQIYVVLWRQLYIKYDLYTIKKIKPTVILVF